MRFNVDLEEAARTSPTSLWPNFRVACHGEVEKLEEQGGMLLEHCGLCALHVCPFYAVSCYLSHIWHRATHTTLYLGTPKSLRTARVPSVYQFSPVQDFWPEK